MAVAAIKAGTKLSIGLESKIKDNTFVLKATYEKKLDDASFLISAPMKNGSIFMIEDTDKLYISYDVGESQYELEGYVDEYIKKGIRTYLKVRKTTAIRQFVQRRDLRVKISLKMKIDKTYWTKDGIDSKEEIPALSMDISNGGVAMFLNANMGAGEIVEMHFPKLKGIKELSVRGETCWVRETEKGNAFKFLVGLKFFLNHADEAENVAKYVQAIASSSEAEQ